MAMNGFLQNGVCFSDINAAYASFSQSLPLPVFPVSSFVQLSFCPNCISGGLNGHYIFQFFDVSLGSRVFNHDFTIDSPVFQSCDPIQPFLDGSLLGFTVAGAVVSVSLLAVLRRAL